MAKQSSKATRGDAPAPRRRTNARRNPAAQLVEDAHSQVLDEPDLRRRVEAFARVTRLVDQGRLYLRPRLPPFGDNEGEWSDLRPSDVLENGVPVWNDGPVRALLEDCGVEKRHWETLEPAERAQAKDYAQAILLLHRALAAVCDEDDSKSTRSSARSLLKKVHSLTDPKEKTGKAFREKSLASTVHVLARRIYRAALAHAKALERRWKTTRVAEPQRRADAAAASASLNEALSSIWYQPLPEKDLSTLLLQVLTNGAVHVAAKIAESHTGVPADEVSRAAPRRR